VGHKLARRLRFLRNRRRSPADKATSRVRVAGARTVLARGEEMTNGIQGLGGGFRPNLNLNNGINGLGQNGLGALDGRGQAGGPDQLKQLLDKITQLLDQIKQGQNAGAQQQAGAPAPAAAPAGGPQAGGAPPVGGAQQAGAQNGGLAGDDPASELEKLFRKLREAAQQNPALVAQLLQGNPQIAGMLAGLGGGGGGIGGASLGGGLGGGR
jgi:hypothetical protein